MWIICKWNLEFFTWQKAKAYLFFNFSVLKDEYNDLESSKMATVAEEVFAENSAAPGLLKNILRMNPGTFDSRRSTGVIQAPSQKKQILDVNAAMAVIQGDTAVAAPNLNLPMQASTSASTAYTIKTDEDEIPEHLKHLFREEAIVQLEPVC